MGVVDSLKANGWKPTASDDGEFKPLVGTYGTSITVLRPEFDKKNNDAKYYQLETKPNELISGDEFGEKFAFRQRFYVDGEKASDSLKKMLNILFTAGVELDTSSDEAMEADFINAIGKPLYVRAWGWEQQLDSSGKMVSAKAASENPSLVASTKSVQMWVAQKQTVAEKKRTASSHNF